MNNFPGEPRSFAAGFAIGGKGYMGTGSNSLGVNLQDFWEYNAATDTWTQKANFPGVARSSAVGFEIGTVGYIGTGMNLADFWEYNPSTNSWTAKANYGGGAMSGSSGFGISSLGKGYLGATGLDALSNFTKKFYEYDQATNVWTSKAQPPLNVGSNPVMRYWAVEYAIGTKGYMMSGMGTMAANCKDLYEYNPATNTWATKAVYTAGFGLWEATGFGIGAKGYLVTGEDDTGTMVNNNREYDPASNTWVASTPFPSLGRVGSVGFTINGCGYVITGRMSNGVTTNEVWKFCPVVLPIELVSFTGENNGNKNLLQWKTQTESNNHFFTLERSTDAVNFYSIAVVQGAGNSRTEKFYSYNDEDLPGGATYYYRLKQTDFDKQQSYSGLVSITSSSEVKALIYFDGNCDLLKINANLQAGAGVIVEVIDPIGTVVYSESIFVNGDVKSITPINLSSLAKGAYLVRLSEVSGKVIMNSKFVK
jgi:hypothetical protein